MVISNSSTNSLVGTSYAQPAAAAHSGNTASTTGASSTDSVHLSSTAQATGLHQQGLSISQIASLMGVTSKEVESYLYITPTAAIGSGGGGGGAAPAAASQKSAAPTPAASTSSAAAAKPAASATTGVTATPKLQAA